MAQEPAVLRKERDSLQKRGMHRELLDLYRDKLMALSDGETGGDLRVAVGALRDLNAWQELDELVESAVTAHSDDGGLLMAAAEAYRQAPHVGRMVAGRFERGMQTSVYGRRPGRGAGPSAGEWLEVEYRDFVRALQLVRRSVDLSESDATRSAAWRAMAGLLREREAWKWQTLTPLEALPEWGEPGPAGGTEGAAWDREGPVLYQVPGSWEAARNDGERWRFALAEQTRLTPDMAAKVIHERGEFAESQFGLRTLQDEGYGRGSKETQGFMDVRTLEDEECLAETSAGVRRFKLPADQHFIALYQEVMDQVEQAGDRLVQVYLERQQFDRARRVLERVIGKHGEGEDGRRKKLLAQITGDWGYFLDVENGTAGTRPRVPLIFRNATSMEFTAAPVDIQKVYNDRKKYLESNPENPQWERMDLDGIERLLQEEGTSYIGEATAKWTQALVPGEKHANTRAEVEVPVAGGGVWWITAKTRDGHSFHTVVWLAEIVLVRHSLDGGVQWWVADAVSGAPVAGASIEFFGSKFDYQERKRPGDRITNTLVKQITRTTDAEGKVVLRPGEWDPTFQWVARASAEGKAPAISGAAFQYSGDVAGDLGARDAAYGISDRPLYKPGDTVRLKYYFRNVSYFGADEKRWANQSGVLTVQNGRGEEVVKMENLRTDALGGMETALVIPKEAGLGVFHARYDLSGGVSAMVTLRVEEYRKPEFEVTVDAPAAPVKLGETFTALVRAQYFHGAPVRNAEVEITVRRSSMSERWFPVHRWDWLYGAGAWWAGSEADWHPTWRVWGCMPPMPPWWDQPRWTPDELVLKTRVAIGADGTAAITIDTAPAKLVHGDMDASYQIEARVVDGSRREERGSGRVIAARKPFEVVVWTDRGHARAGDALEARVTAATLAGKPVAGARGVLRLWALQPGANGGIEEKEVKTWDIETDAAGEVRMKIAAPEVGQYRLAASLSHAGGETVEGAFVLNIHGAGRTDPGEWRFGPLELVPDRSTYAPGETVKLRVNSDHPDAHVWLFLHMMNGGAREARRIQLDGKSLEMEVPLDGRDMPNMFVEGLTVHRGRVYSEVRQILLPPVSKLIDVTLSPAQLRVKPRAQSSMRIHLQDGEGKPIAAEAVVTVYDKALEAITGGSNVGPIHQAFWDWKRFYQKSWEGSERPPAFSFVRPGEVEMDLLGQDHGIVRVDFLAGGGGGRSRSMLSKGGAVEADMELTAMAAPMAAGAAPEAPPILVRKDFADLLKWVGSVKTDSEGNAEIPLEFPDNLTTWKARVWTLAGGTQVGEGTAEIITSKELLVRLQAPRFLVERDEAVLSAMVQNDHDAPKEVKVSLEVEGRSLEVISGGEQTLRLAAKSEGRLDWRVRALREGEVTLRMRADSGDDGDAVERKLPVHVHGMLRQDAWSRVLAPDEESAKIPIQVPAERRAEASRLTVRCSPTIAGAVVDAIPYLADFPHGCTEQTLNRFVPAVVARKMLRDLGIDLAEVKAARNNLNPQELGDAAGRKAQWKQWAANPVFDEAELDRMTAKGIERLVSMQNSDGGWGWFSGYGESSYAHTTAIVVHGLLTARANGTEVPARMLDRGVEWLQGYERGEVAALQRHSEREALRKEGKKPAGTEVEKSVADALDALVRRVLGEAARDSEPMLASLYRDRLALPVYGKCLLGLELHRKEDEARRDEVMRMISQFLKRDAENQTAYLDLGNANPWWYWYGSGVEANAWYLELLSAVKPEDADARGVVKYLVNNRQNATYWESTRDTALAVEAIASYFKASGESAPDMEMEILMDGRSLKKLRVTRENLFTFDGTVVLTGEELATGGHEVELRKSGKGALFANAYLEVFTLEDKLRAAGLEVKVSRRVSKLVPLTADQQVPDAGGMIASQKVERFRREALAEGARLASGDRVEVELVLESKNDYEYLMFSDAKAAGFEAVEALSGYLPGGAGFHAYMEPRDRTVDFFIRALPRGTHTLRYELRAESPGNYKALPATVEAMYAPELRGNSEDLRLQIGEKGE